MDSRFRGNDSIIVSPHSSKDPALFALVAQWIERKPPELKIKVRSLSRVPKNAGQVSCRPPKPETEVQLLSGVQILGILFGPKVAR